MYKRCIKDETCLKNENVLKIKKCLKVWINVSRAKGLKDGDMSIISRKRTECLSRF